MKLMPATDLDLVRRLYTDVIDRTPDISAHARWAYGKHPRDELLRTYIGNGELYLLSDDTGVLGAVALVMRQGDDYSDVSWAETLPDDNVMTVHLLAVCPDCRGRRLGSAMLALAEDMARRAGKRAVRLDVLAANLPAIRMYERAGYAFRGKKRMYAENTGFTDFLFYEKCLL